jgi:hypothetical protein
MSALMDRQLASRTEQISAGPLPGELGPNPRLQRCADHASSGCFKGMDSGHEDEALIRDVRAELSPAEMVERKLYSMLRGRLVPLSHVRMASLPGRHRPR